MAPLPVRLMVAPVEELIIALKVALADPAPDGVNVMLPLAFCPGFSVNGSVTPLMEKAEEFRENCVTVRLEPPLLDMEIVSDLLLPTFTVPKSRLDEENCRTPAEGLLPGGGVVVADAPPPQPVITKQSQPRHKTAMQRRIVTFKIHLRATF